MRKLALFGIVVCVVGWLCVSVGGRAAANTTATNSITRELEPVILPGGALPMYAGVPIDQLYVYVYRDGLWTPIAAQVDEVNPAGSYVTYEDGALDANDEVVFMARDLGDLTSAAPVPGGQITSASWYQVAVDDPTSPGSRGWAYVLWSPTSLPVASSDYVSFVPAQHRIVGSMYQLGFANPRAWLDYLVLGAGGAEILDRAPKYRFCHGILCLNENASEEVEDGLIKDGPVRVIARAGRVLAYGWMTKSSIPINIPASLAPDFIRFSTDFTASAAGSIVYNAAVPGGVVVDGAPETVPGAPFSTWWQFSSPSGTMIQVFDVSELGGTASNYYMDDARTDNQDTGDKLHYGDTGVRVDQPNLSFTYRSNFYFLKGARPNMGTTYANYYEQPLGITATWQQLSLRAHLYLPVVLH